MLTGRQPVTACQGCSYIPGGRCRPGGGRVELMVEPECLWRFAKASGNQCTRQGELSASIAFVTFSKVFWSQITVKESKSPFFFSATATNFTTQCWHKDVVSKQCLKDCLANVIGYKYNLPYCQSFLFIKTLQWVMQTETLGICKKKHHKYNTTTTARKEELDFSVYRMQGVLCNRASFTKLYSFSKTCLDPLMIWGFFTEVTHCRSITNLQKIDKDLIKAQIK